MKSLKNRVQLIGNLGKNPEIRNFENNRKMATFTIATNNSYRDAQGKRIQDTQWHNIVAWGSMADIAERYLEKGRQVAIEGKLVHRSFDDKNGAKKYVTEVVASEVVMLDSDKKN